MSKKKFTAEQLQGSTPKPESILSRTASAGMSGLSAVANLIDLPGSSVRDVIAGQNPVDQYMTPFSEQNRVTGRDLNRHLGFSGTKDTTGNWWGGLATEIATDPLTYLSLGGAAVAKGAGSSMAKAGIKGLEAARIATKAAKAGDIAATGARWVGPREARLLLTPSMVQKHAPDMFSKLASTAKAGGVDLAGQMNSPMGALAKFWPTQSLLGTGDFGRKVARGMDVAGDYLRHTKIPGTDIMPLGDIANLMNRKAGGARSAEALQTAYHNFNQKEAAITGVRSLAGKWANEIVDKGHKDTDALQMRSWLETGTEPAELKPIFDEMRSWADEIPGKAKELGVRIYDTNKRIKAAGGNYRYWMRRATEGVFDQVAGIGKDFSPTTRSAMKRMDWSVGVKGGTKTIAEMAKDPNLEQLLSEGLLDAAGAYIRGNYGNVLPKQYITKKQYLSLKELGYRPSVKGALKAVAENPALAHKLAPRDTVKGALRSLKRMSPELRKSGIFGNHPINDFLAMAVGTQEKLRASEIALQHILDTKVVGKGEKLGKVLKELGLDQGDETGGAVKWLTDRGFDAKGHSVHPEAAKFLIRENQKLRGGPDEINAWFKFYDKIANITKAAFTNLDPIRFNVRNRMSGAAANVLSDQHTFESIAHADKLIKGQVIPGAAQNAFLAEEAAKRGIQNLDDATATKILSEMAFAREVTGGYGVDNVARHSGKGGGQLGDVMEQLPGGHPFKWGDVYGKLAGKGGTTWNPWSNWRGVTQGAEKSTFAPLAFGEDLSHYAESMNRLAPFWALMQKGVHPDEAARLVNLAQVGYQTRNYTQFENQVLKRLALFYSFQKGMVPFTLQQLIENPGGRLAQTLRAMNKARGENELVPQHIAETAAIPLNGGPLDFLASKEPGTNSYLSGFGMGFEDPAQFAVPSLQNAGLEMISRSNPLIKAPLESIFGASTYQRAPGGGGRALEDLDPALGRTLANIGEITGLRTKKTPVRYPGSGVVEQVLSNSPISNLLTKARTVTDPRKSLGAKAMNLFSGVKVTDVSPATQDRELLNRVAQIEKEMGSRTFSLSYIPKDRKEELTDKEKKDLAVIAELKRLLSERSKGRRKD